MKEFLAKARILIIDDFSEFRLSLKAMLSLLWAHNIDQASNGSEAIKLCTENRYNIIFCDYNLGDGQNGQHILEELHERSIIRRGTLFLMVTAETTTAQVMGAIEYRPDSYLSKPFTGEQLEQRLSRLISKNTALSSIYSALNENQLQQALFQCDEVMAASPKVRFSCLRIKSEIYEQLHDYARARDIFQDVIQQQPLPWAMLGLGKIYFQQGDILRAQDIFLEMRQSFPQQVSVVDWLAKCKSALGEVENAEQLLLEAIAISPRSVRRQATLGAVAASLGHYDIAQNAYLRVTQDGGYSCLLQPQHFQHYFEYTKQVIDPLSGRDKSRMMLNAEDVFKKLERKYRNDPSVMAPNLSAVALLLADNGQNDKAAGMLSRLSKALENPDCQLNSQQLAAIELNMQALPTDIPGNSYLSRISTGLSAIGQQIAQHPDPSSDTEETPLDSLEVPLYTVSNKLQDAKQINREGLRLFQEHQPVEALDRFRKAIALVPGTPSFLLNAAHTIIESQSLRSNPGLIAEARRYLGESNIPGGTAAHRDRYEKLMAKLSSINHFQL